MVPDKPVYFGCICIPNVRDECMRITNLNWGLKQFQGKLGPIIFFHTVLTEKLKLLNSIMSAQNELPIPFLPVFRPLVSWKSQVINSISYFSKCFRKLSLRFLKSIQPPFSPFVFSKGVARGVLGCP